VKFRDDIIVSISFIREDGYGFETNLFRLVNNHHHSCIFPIEVSTEMKQVGLYQILKKFHASVKWRWRHTILKKRDS